MNKDRRTALEAIISDLENQSMEIDSLMNEEQDYYDNMPESIQNGEKGEIAQGAIDAMQAAIDAIDEAISSLNESTGN